jgi:hypothetical protein
LDSGEAKASPLRELEEAAIGRVHVQPDTLLARDLEDRIEVVDRSRVGRAGRRDDHARPKACSTVASHGIAQVAGVHAELRRRRDEAQVRPPEACERCRLRDRPVRLARQVDRPVEEVFSESRVARGDHRRKRRNRAARGERPSGLRGEAEELAEPTDRCRLELHSDWRRLPHPDEAIRRSRDELGERRAEQASTGNVREPAVTRRVVPFRGCDLDRVEELRERSAGLRSRDPQLSEGFVDAVEVGGRGVPALLVERH